MSIAKTRVKARTKKKPVEQPLGTKPWTESLDPIKSALFTRLVRAATRLESCEALAPQESIWLGGILWRLIEGNDLRPMVLDPPTRGRREKYGPDEADGDLWVVADALFTSAETTIKGKLLWAKLADKWGYPDGTIRNLITKHRASAAALINDSSVEEMKKIISDHLAVHKNSRN